MVNDVYMSSLQKYFIFFLVSVMVFVLTACSRSLEARYSPHTDLDTSVRSPLNMRITKDLYRGLVNDIDGLSYAFLINVSTPGGSLTPLRKDQIRSRHGRVTLFLEDGEHKFRSSHIVNTSDNPMAFPIGGGLEWRKKWLAGIYSPTKAEKLYEYILYIRDGGEVEELIFMNFFEDPADV